MTFEIKTVQAGNRLVQTTSDLWAIDHPEEQPRGKGYRAQKSYGLGEVKNGAPVTWNNATFQMPEWADLMGGSKLRGPEGAYAAVPLFFRALNLRCSDLVGVPNHVEDIRTGKIVDWPFPTPLEDLLWNTEAGMLLFGHSEWLKRGTQKETASRIIQHVDDVEWLHTRFSIPWYDPGRNILYFSYSHPGPDAGQYNQDQLVIFREFNPLHKYLPGPSAGQAALENVGLTHYLTHFAKSFFEGGAMPAVLMWVDGPAPTPDVAKETETKLKNLLTSVSNAFHMVMLRLKIGTQILTPPFKDMVMPELFDQAQQEVGKAFAIPQTLLDEASNKNTGNDDERHFYQDTIIPRARRYAAWINRQLLQPAGLKLVMDTEELPIMQEDEGQRGKTLYYNTQAGVPLAVAMDILGYKLSDDQRAQIAATSAKPPTPPAQPVVNPEPVPAAVAAEQAATITPDMTKDLDLWRQIATRNFKKGKGKAIDFEVKALPNELADGIREKLKDATNEDEISQAFEIRATPNDNMALVREALDWLEQHEAKMTTGNTTKQIGNQSVIDALLEMTKSIDNRPITVNLPEMKQPQIVVNVPQQEPPLVTVNVPPAQITVNVPEQAAPVINIPAPQVSLTMPEKKKTKVSVVRDSNGRLTGIEEK